MIEVNRAGVLTSVQDLGRPGYRHLGVCLGGALDPLALTVANRLVGNAPNAAGIEFILGPVVMRFRHRARIALTGADFGASLDDTPVFAWWSIPVEAGQTLTLRAPRRGMRAYLAVAGGIDVIPMLGSRGTDLNARFGGLGGRALRDSDRLPIGVPDARTHAALADASAAFGIKPPGWCAFATVNAPRGPNEERGASPAVASAALVVRVLRGPEYDKFSDAARQTFWRDDWSITPNSNRMGYRLAGATLRLEAPRELLSHAVLPGTIQVPPNGQPIVLMDDAQTAGGYPKIGSVISADLRRLAQARLNSTVRFVEVTLDQAREALRQIQAYLRQIEVALDLQAERNAVLSQ